MPSPTHRELVDQVLPLFHGDPDRFLRFYDAVYLKLITLPEGAELRITDHVSAQYAPLFLKLATITMIEENHAAGSEVFCFSGDDYGTIRHNAPFVPSRVRKFGWFNNIQSLESNTDSHE